LDCPEKAKHLTQLGKVTGQIDNGPALLGSQRDGRLLPKAIQGFFRFALDLK